MLWSKEILSRQIEMSVFLFLQQKSTESCCFRCFSCRNLTLGELRRATGGFEAVLLALLHTRIAGEETGLLEDGTIVGADEQERTGDAVAQSARLTGHTAAGDGGNDVPEHVLADHERDSGGLCGALGERALPDDGRTL